MRLSLIGYTTRALQIAIATGGGWWLARAVGPWQALEIGAVVAAGAVAAAVVALRTSPVGRITWKNSIAGLLMPWGYALGRGRLLPIAIACWVIWMLLFLSGIFMGSGNRYDAAATSEWGNSPVIQTLLVISWLILGAATLFLLNVLLRQHGPDSRGRISILKIVGMIVLLLGISVTLWFSGRPVLALLVAGGPPLALASVYGAFFAVMLTAGKNARWN